MVAALPLIWWSRVSGFGAVVQSGTRWPRCTSQCHPVYYMPHNKVHSLSLHHYFIIKWIFIEKKPKQLQKHNGQKYVHVYTVKYTAFRVFVAPQFRDYQYFTNIINENQKKILTGKISCILTYVHEFYIRQYHFQWQHRRTT